MIRCKSGCENELSIDELDEVLEMGNCPSEGCDSPIVDVDPGALEVQCVECEWQEACSWNDAMTWLTAECPRCRSNAETSGEIRLVGTRQHEIGIYESFAQNVDVSSLRRKRRPDYWEIVIHFTNRENFISICKQGKIQAKVTGYFQEPAVCLTDTPIEFSSELKSTYGEFGFVFKKSDVLTAGGGPVAYLSDAIIRQQRALGGFSDAMKPFINIVRIPSTAPVDVKKRKIDFLHDREWRLPSDLDFSSLQPIGIVLPDRPNRNRFSGIGGREIFEAAREYGEL